MADTIERNTPAAGSAPDREPVGGSGQRGYAIWIAAIAAALIASRWALFPRYLNTFDQINFALAVDHFDPALHQPQPPGYPVFVALLKGLSLFGTTIETVLLLAGLLVSAMALVLLWRLCQNLGEPGSGLIAVALLLFNPVFWLSALTNPVRLCFAAGALAVGLCLWNAVRAGSSRWFCLAAGVLGLCTGARPALALILTPLVLWAAFHLRLRWKPAALAALCFVAAVATWLPFLIAAAGGLGPYRDLLRAYSAEQFSGTSTVFGATLREAIPMAWQALAWSCLGALSWFWAIPAFRGRPASQAHPLTRQFLAVWFVPSLFFFAIVHVADPDHTLSIVPVTCIAGALILAARTRTRSRRTRHAAIALCVVLNVVLFLKPISRTTKACTYTPVRWLNGQIAGVVEGAGSLLDRGPLTVLFDDATPGWRNLSYYHPQALIVVVMHPNAGPPTARQISGRQAARRPVANGPVTLPACGTLAWVDPVARPVARQSLPVQAANSRVFFTPAVPGESFDFRGVSFIFDGLDCNAANPNLRR